MSYFTNSFDDKVAGLLQNGAVGLLPTDTIYGLSGSALNKTAVEKIHRLKGKEPGRPLIVLISSLQILNMLSIPTSQAKDIEKYWPGKISLEFQTPHAPHWLHFGKNHFAVRMPDYPELRNLIDAVGPIVSTSANLTGEKPVSSVKEAREIFGDKLDFYVDAGKLSGEPSTLVVNENGKLKVIRQGAVKIDDAR